jgi:NAD(P)-dependent dehydrogenase (short-subunit alcohol dehydrogenase family)
VSGVSRREVEGRVALVTGASRGGIGTAIALRLAAEGAKVAISGRSEKGLAACRDQICAAGGQCAIVPADLADPAGARVRLVADVEAALGPVDILVHSGATNGYKPFGDWTREELLNMYEINLFSAWELMRQAVPGMRARGRGWILNLTSFAGEMPFGPPFPSNIVSRGGSAYGSSKAALNRLTAAVASECEGVIAVNALAPQAAARTERLARGKGIDEVMFEPLETMAEAALALVSADPAKLSARIAFSLQLLVELRRPVRDLRGEALLAGWQPDDIALAIERQSAAHAALDWKDAYAFGRPHSPDPRRGARR